MGSPSCTYPCASNGEVCALAGSIQYGVYACPGSEAALDTYCSTASAASPTLCNHTAACQTIPGSSNCIAQFKYNILVHNKSMYSQYLTGTLRCSIPSNYNLTIVVIHLWQISAR